MWLAPATIACTKVRILRPGHAPPTRPPRRTVALIRRSRSSRPTSVATSKSPALATRLGSSKVTRIRSILRDTDDTESASLVLENCDFEHRNSSRQGGTFRGYADLYVVSSSVDRGLDATSMLRLWPTK